MLKNKKIITYILIIIAPLLWASNTVIARKIHNSIPPCSLAFWRWYIAFIILILTAGQHLKNDWNTIKLTWKSNFRLSYIGITAFNILLYTALHTTTAINGAIISSLMPSVIVCTCFLLYKEKISFLQLYGMFLCFIGVFYIISKGKISTLIYITFVPGDIFLILATIMYGIYSAMLLKIISVHPLSYIFITSVMSSIELLPLYIGELILLGTFKITHQIFWTIIYVSFLPSIIAYLCWNKGIKSIGANRTGLFINLIPIFTSSMAIIFLNESVHLYHIVGIVIISLGIIIFNYI